ncbi:MAG: hypothetical protein HOI47_25215 [Candidatus Scalindua sp.]|jgi:hypothetical protein|nr:hypothetical protein [Gammaproteobacteria bacterium]MBT6229956.1 hypothetical protein [Candidatus Scalindua sp.]
MYKLTIIALTLLFAGTGCAITKTWTGYYYPDANNIGDSSSWIIEGGFGSLTECRNWVDAVASLENNVNFDYECGYDCEYNSTYGMSVCDRTEQ